ncbi:hypothetical protein [Nocardia paucivorans]|uniref:hypothetical protein n=1 Tax=Nocardia paucivorans TaxID=114259 RepID=UPI0012F95FDF|nr:hypothetical protein [Nocardia paucivorans]
MTTCGFAVAAIDAPGYGDRPRTTEYEQHIAVLRQAAGEPIGPTIAGLHTYLAERAAPERQATLDVLQELPQIGTEGRSASGASCTGHQEGKDVARQRGRAFPGP